MLETVTVKKKMGKLYYHKTKSIIIQTMNYDYANNVSICRNLNLSLFKKSYFGNAEDYKEVDHKFAIHDHLNALTNEANIVVFHAEQIPKNKIEYSVAFKKSVSTLEDYDVLLSSSTNCSYKIVKFKIPKSKKDVINYFLDHMQLNNEKWLESFLKKLVRMVNLTLNSSFDSFYISDFKLEKDSIATFDIILECKKVIKFSYNCSNFKEDSFFDVFINKLKVEVLNHEIGQHYLIEI